ncbi:MAG: hypothetical protein OIF51_05355 [Cellvibrionaceae bacterium]|nr:hypothetical protein [Cellvibrionaceae bacterium]
MSEEREYSIRKHSTTEHQAVIITQSEFGEIRNAFCLLRAIHDADVMYAMALDSYKTFEKELLSAALELNLGNFPNDAGLFEHKVRFNSYIVGFLSSFRIYNSHLQKRTIWANSNVDLKSIVSEVYDTCYEYRFCEELRNYIHHDNMAIHTIRYPTMPLDANGGDYLYNAIIPYFVKSHVDKDHWRKKRALNETGDQLALVNVISTGMEALSRIHESMFASTMDVAKAARERLQYFSSKYIEKFGGNDASLLAIEANSRGQNYVSISLAADPHEHTKARSRSFKKLTGLRYKLPLNREIPDIKYVKANEEEVGNQVGTK